MPKKNKPVQRPSKVTEVRRSKPESTDYEQFLIDKISKCQRVVEQLKNNPVWEEIKADYENTAKGLDMSWAYEDVNSPRFKQMQASKMAVQTFLNLLPSYENDLKLATKELEVFRSPKSVIKKDYDDEGVAVGKTSIPKANAYHGEENEKEN